MTYSCKVCGRDVTRAIVLKLYTEMLCMDCDRWATEIILNDEYERRFIGYGTKVIVAF